MTKEEYIQWVDNNIKFGGLVDLDEEEKKAETKFAELTSGMTVEVVTHDWKSSSEHMCEVLGKIKEINAKSMYHFMAFHDFPNGQLDALVTVLSDADITEEFAEILSDLVVNLGASGEGGQEVKANPGYQATLLEARREIRRGEMGTS